MASPSAFAATPSLFGSCDSNGECSAIFNRSLPEAKALCGERTASVAWRRDSKSFLLQCVGFGTDHEDNSNYVVNGLDIVGLNYGRYVKVSLLQQSPSTLVPDKFGAVQVCSPPSLVKLRTTTFVLLDKRPTKSGASYCYDVTYLNASDHSVQLDTNVGTVKPNDKSYFAGRLTDRTRQRVERLFQAFQTWHNQQAN
jgi:hypothetical protein